MNLFDGLQDKLFDLTTNVFGYDASWQPSVGGALQTAKVHYKKPTEIRGEFNHVEYNPFIHLMEYKQGDFIGLIESVRDRVDEIIMINNISFYIREIKAKWDGKSFYAQLEPYTP